MLLEEDCSFLQPANASPTASASATFRSALRGVAGLWMFMTHVDLVFGAAMTGPPAECSRRKCLLVVEVNDPTIERARLELNSS